MVITLVRVFIKLAAGQLSFSNPFLRATKGDS